MHQITVWCIGLLHWPTAAVFYHNNTFSSPTGIFALNLKKTMNLMFQLRKFFAEKLFLHCKIVPSCLTFWHGIYHLFILDIAMQKNNKVNMKTGRETSKREKNAILFIRARICRLDRGKSLRSRNVKCNWYYFIHWKRLCSCGCGTVIQSWLHFTNELSQTNEKIETKPINVVSKDSGFFLFYWSKPQNCIFRTIKKVTRSVQFI